MTAPILLHPTSESVVVTWLSGWFPVGAATTLPKPGTWPVLANTVTGFATVTVVGGRTLDNGLRLPVVSCGTWAAVPGSDRPQWGAASHLAELLVHAAQDEPFAPVTVRPSIKHASALVQSIRLLTEPRRIPDQDESVAHFETEFVLAWTETA